MKIEKINNNQIRCTLTKEDLDNHQIRISELAYGSEKAKKLFHDMMQQAQIEFGFEADNIPLMVEAIPINMESVILIITKVEDPDELDTRFSKFAPFKDKSKTETLELDGADNIIDLIQKLCESKMKGASNKTAPAETKKEKELPPVEETNVDLIRLYSFSKLDSVIEAAHALQGFFHGENTLYKDKIDGFYHLVIHQSAHTPEDFNKICNILSEYSSSRSFNKSGEAHLIEHGEVITANAIQTLTQL